MRPTIFFLQTGGTISTHSTEAGAVRLKTSINKLLAQLDHLGVNIEDKGFVIEKGSAFFIPEDWVKIAEATADAIKAGADGVVILHGTDTMHYTASALSFMLKDLGRPVVMTGSVIPGADSGSDALFNLENAITTAAFADLAEVCIVFSADLERNRGMIIRGCRARKIHSAAFDAFASVNILPIGYVKDGKIVYTGVKAKKRGTSELNLLTKLDTNVVLVKQNPALTVQTLTKFLEGASGAVIEGTGAGHIREDLVEVVASFNRPVVMSTQAIFGGVKWGIYALDKAYLATKNFISGGDMTSEAALVKLMWALGQGGDIRSTMLTNIAGEITPP